VGALDDLDALDAELRALRREQLKHWIRLWHQDTARARAVLEDPAATHEQKHEARILLSVYAMGPGVSAGLTRFAGTFDPHKIEHHNHHSYTPDPPSALHGLKKLLARGSERSHELEQTEWPKPPIGPPELAPAYEPPRPPTPVTGPPIIRSDDDAPDLVEEILGWKVLSFADTARVGGDGIALPGSLASPAVYVEWGHAGWTQAKCKRHPEHEPPVEDCTCGIYAVSEARRAFAYLENAPLTVLARVGLAGKVIPGAKGWRAERARVVAMTRTGLGPRDYPHMLARVADHYRVPILDLDFLAPRPTELEA
jgi:hypothetical protein